MRLALLGCRLPLNIGFLPLPVDPISKAMTHPLRSTAPSEAFPFATELYAPQRNAASAE